MRRMRIWTLSVVLLGCLSPSRSIVAQSQLATPEQVAAGLRSNLKDHFTLLPQFSCEEHIVSRALHKGKVHDEKQLVTAIRAKRPEANKPSLDLKEVREVQSIDGKPAKDPHHFPNIPLDMNGVFANSFTAFAEAHSSCYSYRLTPAEAAGAQQTVVLTMESLPNQGEIAACKGMTPNVRIASALDAKTYQIMTMATEVPRAEIDDRVVFKTFHFRDLTIRTTYAPVMLGSTQYLLPASVHADISDPEQGETIQFDARYIGCHRYETTSTIVSSPPPVAAP